MTFGALIAAVAGGSFMKDQVGFIGDLAGPALVATAMYPVIVIGKLTVNFVLARLMGPTSWSATNLIDYYLISKERIDIPALYDAAGRCGAWNVTALSCYALGVAVQIPFPATKLYTGPVTG